MSFDQADYHALQESFKRQRQLRVESFLPHRWFSKPQSWANPGQEPCMIDPMGTIVAATEIRPPPRVQQRAIGTIRNKIASTSTGRDLLKLADQGRVSAGFELGNEGGALAAYVYGRRDILFNANSRLLEHEDVASFVTQASFTGAHELTHVAQDRHVGRDFGRWDLRIPVMHQIMATRHFEAAADAVAVDVAWQLKEAGDQSLWRMLETDPVEAPLAQAFAKSVAKNPDNASNGKARRAAHDAWFKNQPALAHYDQDVINRIRGGLEALAAQQAAGFPDATARQLASDAGRLRLSRDSMRDYGVMPDGVDHLRLEGHPDVWHENYTKPSSTAMHRQAELLHSIVKKLSSGMVVQEGDFTALDEAKKLANVETGLTDWRARRRATAVLSPSPAP